MKKVFTFVLSGLIMMGTASVVSSCSNDSEKAETKDGQSNNQAKPSAQGTAANVNCKIAYVQIDTLTSQYQKCKDLEEEFTKKRANAEATINAKGKSFADQMQAFENKVRSNQYTQQQFEAEQARLGKLQQELQDLQLRLSNSLQEEYQKEFQALTDTIQNFTRSYAKEKGFDFILCKSSGIDNVLYADEAYDVTNEVVTALNKRYSKK